MVFVVLFSFVSTFFKMTDAVNIATIEGFYKEPKNTIDVMMIGASEVYADYSATEAWKNYEYTSYSLGGIRSAGTCTNLCSEKLSPDSIRRLWFF